jgi:hypothetical protein
VHARSPVVATFESAFINICVLTFWVGREGSGSDSAMDLEEEESQDGPSADEHGDGLPEGWALGQAGRKKLAYVWSYFLKKEAMIGNKPQVVEVMWVPGA